MRSIQSQAMPIVQALWRHRWLAVGTAWLVCTAGWIGAAFVPTKYESSARVYLNADPLLTPLLKGLAADTDPSRHLDFMQRTLLDDEFVCLASAHHPRIVAPLTLAALFPDFLYRSACTNEPK